MEAKQSALGACLTVLEVAKSLRIDPGKVRAFIAAGRLRAINVGLGTRPRWRIRLEDLQAFERSLEARPAQRIDRRRRLPDVRTKTYF